MRIIEVYFKTVDTLPKEDSFVYIRLQRDCMTDDEAVVVADVRWLSSGRGNLDPPVYEPSESLTILSPTTAVSAELKIYAF